jgi:hypothetical protein
MASTLDALIVRLHREASATRNPVALDPARCAQHLATCVANTAAADPLPPVEALCATDLYLGCALGHGVPGAHLRFARQFEETVAEAARTIDAAPSFVDEVRQALHQNLTLTSVDGGAGPKILQYAGRAPLASWVATAARRTALALVSRLCAARRGLALDSTAALRAGDFTLGQMRSFVDGSHVEVTYLPAMCMKAPAGALLVVRRHVGLALVALAPSRSRSPPSGYGPRARGR